MNREDALIAEHEAARLFELAKRLTGDVEDGEALRSMAEEKLIKARVRLYKLERGEFLQVTPKFKAPKQPRPTRDPRPARTPGSRRFNYDLEELRQLRNPRLAEAIVIAVVSELGDGKGADKVELRARALDHPALVRLLELNPHPWLRASLPVQIDKLIDEKLHDLDERGRRVFECYRVGNRYRWTRYASFTAPMVQSNRDICRGLVRRDRDRLRERESDLAAILQLGPGSVMADVWATSA